MTVRFTYLLLLLLSAFIPALGQKTDSTEFENDTLRASWFTSSDWFLTKHMESTFVDTTLDRFHIYRRENQDDDFLINHGNAGQACSSLRFHVHVKDMFEHGHSLLSPYLTPSDEVRYYITDKPFSELFFVSGSKKEALFHVVHTQNVTHNLNVGIRFDLTNSDGAYYNQRTDDRGLILNARYISPNKRYNIYSHYIYNRLKIAENGGLSQPEEFEAAAQTNSNFYGVNLTQSRNTVRRNLYYFGQSVDLVTDKKTIPKDSTRWITRHYNPRLRLCHQLTYENRSYAYRDPLFGFDYYPNAFNDPEETYDSTFNYTLSNSLTLALLENDSTRHFLSKIQAWAGIKHYLGYISQPDTNVQDVSVTAGLHTSRHSLLTFSVDGELFVFGASAGDHAGNAALEFNSELKNNKNLHAAATLTAGYFGQSFMDESYSSNHFQWDYAFEHSTYYESGVHLEYEGYKISYSHSNITNMIYYDVQARPKQYTLPLNVSRAEFEKMFAIRNMRMGGHVMWQNTDHSNIARIPEFVVKGSFAFHKYAFKKALLWGLGTDVLFFTGYYADTYMPATMVMYQQNEKKIGEYPFIDVYLSAKIKRARFFAKMEHANAGLMGNTYYLLPFYPAAGRTFKFGISWIMMN